MANPVIAQLEQESAFIEQQLAARKLFMKKYGWLIPVSYAIVFLLMQDSDPAFRLKFMFFMTACLGMFIVWQGWLNIRESMRRKHIQSELSRLRLAQHVAGENTDFQSSV